MKTLHSLFWRQPSLKCQTAPTLKGAYQGIFRIGAALNPAQFEERDPRGNPIIAAQFSSISTENALKWQSIRSIDL